MAAAGIRSPGTGTAGIVGKANRQVCVYITANGFALYSGVFSCFADPS